MPRSQGESGVTSYHFGIARVSTARYLWSRLLVFCMASETFRPTFSCALRENLVVSLVMAAAVPLLLLARRGSHPGMTYSYVVGVGLISAVLSVLFYTGRFLIRFPELISISEDGLVFTWRNGFHTDVRWQDVRKGALLERWGWEMAFLVAKLSGPSLGRWFIHRNMQPFIGCNH
jgi:hypothetical protein